MRYVAFASLLHDRSKFASALAGVGVAAALMLVQAGLYLGFLEGSSELIARGGGDVWVMGRGTQVLDFGEVLSPAARTAVAAHPCVERARPLLFGRAPLRKPSGALDDLEVVGFEAGAGPTMLWTLREGVPSDLGAPMRVAVDAGDLGRLQLPRRPVGARLEVGGHDVYVAAVTEKIRPFALSPHLFADLDTARRLLGVGDGRATFYALDLADRACEADVIKAVQAHADLQAVARDEFVAMTQAYWAEGSSAGAVLGLAALLALVVGTAVVGQALHAIANGHRHELTMLKAMGASGRHLASFVLWQAGLLAGAGGAIGAAMALLVRALAASAGLHVVLSGGVLAGGLAAVALMCAVASWWSVRRVLTLDASEVFK
jgi:putative ABC transport system permease protein